MPEVTITLKTIDDSSAKVKKVKQEYEGLIPGLEKAGKGLGNFVSQNAALIGVLAGVGTALKVSYDSFQKYAGSVRDLAAVSGTGAEEASKLLQVLDDYQLTAQDVTAATRFMTKQGLTPTIETLAQLSDQYNAINEPMQKNEFILKNLGKGGLQWVNVLKQGGDALRDQSEEVNKALILSDEQIKKAEMARLAVDSWADAWEGLKVSIGGAIGEMIAGAAATKDLTKEAERFGIIHDGMNDRMKNSAFEAFRGQMERGAAATEYYNNILGKTSTVAEETGAALAELSSKNAQTISDAIALQEETDKYNQSQSEILAKISELQAKKAAMYPSETEAIAGINEEINGLKEQYAAGADAFEEAQGRKLAMMALEKIALSDGVAGYSEAEMAKAEAILNTAGIAEDSALRQTLAFEKASQAIADSVVPAQDLQRILDMMKQGYSIDVAINYIENGKPPVVPGAAGATSGPNAQAQAGGYGYAAYTSSSNTPRAKGGPLSRGGWTLVGDMAGGRLTPYSELISPDGMVYDAKTTRWLIRSGIVGGFDSRANAGDLDGGGGGGIYKPPPSLPSPTKAPKKGNGGSGSGSLLSVALGDSAGDVTGTAGVAAAIEQQAQQSQSVAMQIQASVIAAVAQAMGTNTDELRAIRDLLKGQPREIGKTVAYEVVKAVM